MPKHFVHSHILALIFLAVLSGCGKGFESSRFEATQAASVDQASVAPSPAPAPTPAPAPAPAPAPTPAPAPPAPMPSPTPAPSSAPASTSTLGREILVNPGFEIAGTGWGNYSIDNSVMRSGSASIRIGTAASGFSQSFSVASGKTYRFSGYSKTSAQDTGTGFRVYWTNPDGSTKMVSTNLFSSDFQMLTGDFTVPAGVSRVTLAAWTNGGSHVYFDDVSVKEVTALAVPAVVVSEGDSISAGGGSYNSLWSMGTSDISFFRQAVGGAALGRLTDAPGANTLYARKQAVLDRKPATGKFIVSLLIGANDLAGSDPNDYANRLFALCDEFRAAGAVVVVGTILPQGPKVGASWLVHNQKRAVVNDLIRKAVGVRLNAVADFAADPTIGPDSAGSNTVLYPDHLHPSWGAEGGHEYMFRVYKTVMDKLL